MKDLLFPLTFDFKVTTFSNDFTVKDGNGETIHYVEQKMFKLVEDVSVFNNENMTELLYSIKANKWIDFSAAYNFTDSSGKEIGRVARKGWASIWKARYEIFDENQQQDLSIHEENGWIKVADSVLGQLPVVGLLTGYFFNPSYIIQRPDGTAVARLKKEKSFFGRTFSVTKLSEFQTGEEERLVLGLMMMILLERRRG
jgi:uncharacterized protein YxjI